MAKTYRHDAGFTSVARRRKRVRRNRVRGDYDQRSSRGRVATAEAIAESYAEYAELLDMVTRGEL